MSIIKSINVFYIIVSYCILSILLYNDIHVLYSLAIREVSVHTDMWQLDVRIMCCKSLL